MSPRRASIWISYPCIAAPPGMARSALTLPVHNEYTNTLTIRTQDQALTIKGERRGRGSRYTCLSRLSTTRWIPPSR